MKEGPTVLDCSLVNGLKDSEELESLFTDLALATAGLEGRPREGLYPWY